MSFLRNSISALLLLAAGFCAMAQEPDTVAHLNLDKSQITERLQKPMLKLNQGISGEVNVGEIAAIPSFLGNADPIRFVRLLPSVQLNTEMEGGLYMQGSESSMTLVSQGGVPVYGITHLLGLFSVFNSPHYKGMYYATSAGQEGRLGGTIDMQIRDTVARRVGGEFSLGLLSAQGTLSVPTGSKSSLTLSARRTFINLVYGNWLKYGDNPIRYGFTDANLTWMWKPSARDRVWVDFFGCLDHGNVSAGIIERIDAKWYNGLGAVHWTHYYPSATLRQKVYFTTFGLHPDIKALNAYGRMPSYIRDYGYRANLSWNGWDFGAHLSNYSIQPQNPYAERHFSSGGNTGGEPVQNALEAILSATYKRDLGYWLQLEAGVGLNGYLSPEGRFFWGVTPEVDLKANLLDGGTIDLRYGLKRQNLFQLGLTNLGLPCEFWVAAGNLQAPQWSHNISLSYNVQLLNGALALSAETYYRQLYNQLEYVGNFMDIYSGHYSLEGSVARGKGRAFGVNLMAQKQTGKLTGWISYAWSRSLRTFDADKRHVESPSSHERLHELDVVATYDFGRFDVGGTFVLASGAPYTPPTSFYVIGSRMVCEYGDYNSARLPAYSRMDLSANWYFRKGPKGKSGINVSLYNVLGTVNHLAYGLHVNKDRTGYSFRSNFIQLRWLPSIAYFRTF